MISKFSHYAIVASAVVASGCAMATPLPDLDGFRAVEPAAYLASPAAVTSHLVVISVDGLRPDAIERYEAPTMRRLMREGSYTLHAQTILPSKTLPSHTSMVTGVTPEVHGITWNGDLSLLTGPVRVPTMFGLARGAGLQTAAFFSKSKFHHLEVPGTLDHVSSPAGWWGHWSADQTAEEVEDYLEDERPNLTFVHFGEPDYAGHEHGWMTPAYGSAVADADRAIARVLAAADDAFGEGKYTVIVTADHGGKGHEHGLDTPDHRTIPWISWGKGVAAGTVVEAGVRTVDTAATSLWLLGVSRPTAWEGRPVTGAYGARVPTTVAAGG